MTVLSVLDTDTVNISTFRSHNNKHVIVDDNLFVSYLRTCAADSSAQTWRIVKVNQTTKQINTIFEATNATNPPGINRDSAGNLYVVFPDWALNRIFFYRFDKANNYQLAVSTQYLSPGPGSFKSSCAFDLTRNHLVYFGNAGKLVTFNVSGAVLSDQVVANYSAENWIQYPHIYIEPAGRIHLTWSNSHRVDAWWYTSIHYIYSDDAATWRKSATQVTALPVICDDPLTSIQVIDQSDTQLNRVLTSMMPLNGLIHFTYTENAFINDPNGIFTNPTGNVTRYVNYNPAIGTMSSAVLIEESNVGANSIDGELVPDGMGTLYYAATSANKEIVLFATRDNGLTWRLWKRHPLFGGKYPYGVGAHRSLYLGRIAGTLTGRNVATFQGPTPAAETWQFGFSVR